MDWRIFALCRDAPEPDLWFPLTDDEAVRARKVCFACPVRDACAEASAGEPYGIFAGLDEDERRTVRQVARTAG
jgi:WhiB family transcriptional regulator, redox-sensing transcriptional regulator